MDIIAAIAEELQIKKGQAEAAVKLIDEGNTIPFIARYRKEATGSLNDEVLRNLFDRLTYLRNLEDKKQTVLASIEEQDKLTDELKKAILEAQTQVAVDDLYRPYRPKRRTRATIAKEKGLEPLAQTILAQESSVDIMAEAAKYVDAEKDVADEAAALAGAKDIIAENVSDNAGYRTKIRELTMQRGVLYRQLRIQRRSLSMRCTMNLMRLFPRWQVTEHSQLTVVRRKNPHSKDRGTDRGYHKIS